MSRPFDPLEESPWLLPLRRSAAGPDRTVCAAAFKGAWRKDGTFSRENFKYDRPEAFTSVRLQPLTTTGTRVNDGGMLLWLRAGKPQRDDSSAATGRIDHAHIRPAQ
jgi:hypothetical protein